MLIKLFMLSDIILVATMANNVNADLLNKNIQKTNKLK